MSYFSFLFSITSNYSFLLPFIFHYFSLLFLIIVIYLSFFYLYHFIKNKYSDFLL
jgi:hypothetical protein